MRNATTIALLLTSLFATDTSVSLERFFVNRASWQLEELQQLASKPVSGKCMAAEKTAGHYILCTGGECAPGIVKAVITVVGQEQHGTGDGFYARGIAR